MSELERPSEIQKQIEKLSQSSDFQLQGEGITLDNQSVSISKPEDMGIMSKFPTGETTSVVAEVSVGESKFAVIRFDDADGSTTMIGGLSLDESGSSRLNGSWAEVKSGTPLIIGREPRGSNGEDTMSVDALTSNVDPESQDMAVSANHLYVVLNESGQLEIKDTSTNGTTVSGIEVVVVDDNTEETSVADPHAGNEPDSSHASEPVQDQIDDKDNWVKYVVPAQKEVSIPVVEAEETPLQEESSNVKENEETDDSAVEKTEAAQVNSEVMNDRFDKVAEQLKRLSQDALPLGDSISRTPGEIGTEIKSFMQTIEGASNSLNQSIQSIKNLLNAAETGFMTQLEWNANQPIEGSDIRQVENLREVVSRIASQLGVLQSDVERTQQQGTHAQANMSERIVNLMGNTVKSVNEFISNDVRVVASEIDEAGIELSRLALEQANDQEDRAETGDNDNEGHVNEADAQHMDNLSHVKNRLNSESGYLQDDVENAANVVTRNLGLDSQDFTRTLLSAARLQPRHIAEITSDLNSTAMKLEMAARMSGSKGSLYAEIGYGVKQVIERAFDEISMFRDVEMDNADVLADIVGTQSRAKEAAKTAERFVDQLASFARESQRE